MILLTGLIGMVACPVAADAVSVETSRIPLSFIENQGQVDPIVLYHAEAAGHSIFFTGDKVVFSSGGEGANTISQVIVSIPGQDPEAVVKGEDPLAGKANFFLGSDSSGWTTDVPTFGAVRYEGVLPGVDIVYSGTMGLLKREVFLAPGADPSLLTVRYTGQEGLSLDESGSLMVRTPFGTLMEAAPISYQEIEGEKVAVSCSYVLLEEGLVGFEVGPYDPDYPLVIDPFLDFSTYLGGGFEDPNYFVNSNEDRGYSVAVDSMGAIYVTGMTRSTNFPTTEYQRKINQSENGGAVDAFVTKFEPDGKSLNYSTYLGGVNDDVGNGIAVAPDGTVILTGYTISPNFPIEKPFQPVKSNSYPDADAFVTSIYPNGSALRYSSFLGGNMTDVGQAITMNDSSLAVVVGYTGSIDFPNTSGAYSTTHSPGYTNYDAFVTGVNFDGTTSSLAFSSYLGGTGKDQAYGVALNGPGEIFVTGLTDSSNFPNENALATINQGNQDAFVTKMNADASNIVFSTYLGGRGEDAGYGIALDPSGDAYITGYTQSIDFPSLPRLKAFQNWKKGIQDAFLTKIRSDGTGLIFSTYLGGTLVDEGTGIVVDESGSAYIVGFTDSMDFPVKGPLFTNIDGFKYDAFVTRFYPNGTQLIYSTYLGGENDDRGMGIGRERSNVTVTGWTMSRDFPVTPDAFQTTYRGNFDAFVTKIASVAPVANFTGEAVNGYNGTVLKGLPPLTVNFFDTSTGGPTGWAWVFGDGNTSTEQNPSHVYSTGNWTVNLTVNNVDGINTTSKFQYVQVGAPLIVNFSANKSGVLCDPCRGRIPLNVSFTDLTTPPPLTSWNWTFDTYGNYSDQQHPINQTYAIAGVYDVTLRVGNEFGVASITKPAFVEAGDVPKANFTNATPRFGVAPFPVTFTDLSVAVPAVSTWNWSFGDGSGNGTTQNPTHTYTAKGNYTVNLTVTNEYGSDTMSIPDFVRVGELPHANFTGEPLTGVENLLVNFTDHSTGYPNWWLWDFGDGNTAYRTENTTPVNNTYPNAGNFTIALTVGNEYGTDTLTRPRYVSISGNASVADLFFEPGATLVPTNSTTEIALILGHADRGLSGYNLTVYFTDPTAADFVQFSLPSWVDPGYAINGTVPASSVWMKVFDAHDVITPGATNITLAHFNMTGKNPMATTINVSVIKIDTDTGDPVLTYVDPAEVTIVPLVNFPTCTAPPTDPYDDGVYWDVNGNGIIDWDDVWLYFIYLEWIGPNEPVSLFDYNGNGDIDFDDLLLLFNKL
jgi:PKD repeat protein